jgi:hypothetical protein
MQACASNYTIKQIGTQNTMHKHLDEQASMRKATSYRWANKQESQHAQETLRVNKHASTHVHTSSNYISK